MSKSRQLLELSSIIQQKVAIVDQALKDNQLPPPSFDAGAPLSSQIPVSIEETKFDLLEALGELQALLHGPLYHVMYMSAIVVSDTSPFLPNPFHNTDVHQPNNAAIFGVLSKFDIAQALGVDECVSYAELGKRCGLLESETRRLVRGAIALRFFDEPEADKVRHNAASLALATPAAAAWVKSTLRNSAPSAMKLADALAQYPGSEDPRETGFALANGGRDFFTVLQEEPDRGADFAQSMSMQSVGPDRNVSYCVEALAGWDEAKLCPRVIVDVGGSLGTLSEALVRRYSGIEHAIVQDLSKTIANAKVPEDLQNGERMRFVEYDFFTEQPVKDADVYLFRQILHDWSDSKCVEILKSQIPALKPGARIILNEMCSLPPAAYTHARDADHR
jgi:hypothetical protein